MCFSWREQFKFYQYLLNQDRCRPNLPEAEFSSKEQKKCIKHTHTRKDMYVLQSGERNRVIIQNWPFIPKFEHYHGETQACQKWEKFSRNLIFKLNDLHHRCITNFLAHHHPVVRFYNARRLATIQRHLQDRLIRRTRQFSLQTQQGLCYSPRSISI